MEYLGREINQNELIELMSKENNAHRLKWIRQKLNEMYNKEFTKKRVAEDVNGVSYQGLYFLEERGKEPRLDTIKKLAHHYNVPLEIFDKDKPVKTFFLGKKEDEEKWIAAQDEAFMNKEDDGGFDPSDADEYQGPEYEEPEFQLDEFSIEVGMNIFIGNDPNSTMTYLVQERIAIDEEDIEDIRKQINQLIRLLGRKHNQLNTKDREIKEIKRKKISPEEALESIQSYIKGGKLVEDQARIKERMNNRLQRSVLSKNIKPVSSKDKDDEVH